MKLKIQNTRGFRTPIIGLSKWLVETNGLVDCNNPFYAASEMYTYEEGKPPYFTLDDAAFPTDQSTAPADLYAFRNLYVIRAQPEYSPSFLKLQNSLVPVGKPIQDFSATYNFINFEQSTSLFPISHIAIQCLDLNYIGEDMSINTRDLEGTIVPSQMYFLKTFLISTRNTLSDFLYIEDNTMTNTIEVNSPNITRLKFQFFWITPNQELYEFKLPPNNVIQLQLILYPFDTIATKRSRE